MAYNCEQEIRNLSSKFHELLEYTESLEKQILDDRQLADLVNNLVVIAREFHDHQSLRERISFALVTRLKGK